MRTGKQNQKLVAADPGGDVAATGLLEKPRSDSPEHGITSSVPSIATPANRPSTIDQLPIQPTMATDSTTRYSHDAGA